MPTPDETDLISGYGEAGTSPTPPIEPDGDAEKRGRGRPSNAALDARQAELDRRAAALEERERQIALDAAEANLALREAEAARAELRIAAARSGTARSESAHSEIASADGPVAPARGRRYKGDEMPNKFHIPSEQIPLGQSYQWNNYTVFGQEQHAYSAFMEMQGWQPVPAERHPHLVPKGYTGPIIVDGQILMERPQELTNEALQEQLDKARGEVAAKEAQLYGTPEGTMQRSRANGSNEFIGVAKGIERGAPHTPKYEYETPGQGTGAIIE